MPIITEPVTTTTQQFVGFKCNCCGVETDDVFDTQEMMYWRHTCGYGSPFRDGETIEIVLCKWCVEDLLGKFIQTVKEETTEPLYMNDDIDVSTYTL